MIARMWRGTVRAELATEYVDIVERTGMAGYRQTPGNLGAQILTRDLGAGRTEIVTLSWWSDLEQIRAFAGEDLERARYYPEDDDYLLDRDEHVVHYEVAPQPGDQSHQPSGGTPSAPPVAS
jgi:heme-degrading monooxygenase HmoA